MEIVKLTTAHTDAVRPLFEKEKYMGINAETKTFLQDDTPFADLFHEAFVTTYLTDLKNYHAYGAIENGIVQAYIGFYESTDDAAWYWNHIRSFGNNMIKPVLDRVIQHNEEHNRLKFYSMFPTRYTKVYRRLAFSEYNSTRYDYFDEFMVSEKNQCQFTLPWQILYNRTLVPVDTVVRCTFLKQEYRHKLNNAGRL